MLYTIMKKLHNFFVVEHHDGSFKIENGAIDLDFIYDGQYFLIEGSKFNDGVYKFPTNDLTDEDFNGCVTLLAPPKEFLELVDEITKYVAENARDGLKSESFAGYSYARATASNGLVADWQDVFHQRLNTWRKI